MKRKIIGIVLSVLLSALLLVGVSAAAEELTRLVVSGSLGTFVFCGCPEDTIPLAQKVLAKKMKAGTIEDWEIDNEFRKFELMEYMMDYLEPYGYTYDVRNYGWAEPLVQKQTIFFMTNEGPDTLRGETQMPGYAAQGLLLPFPDDLANQIRETCVPGSYLPMTVKGKIYGIAPSPGVNVLFWNKDHFRAAGLDPEVGPETWSEWLEMANKITEVGKGEFYGGGVYAGPHFGGSLRVGPLMMMTPGAGFVDEDNNINFTHPGNIKALEFIRELNKNTPAGIAASPNEGGWWNAYSQGRISFVVDGPWRLGAGTQAGIDVGYCPLPIPDENGRPANVTIGAEFHGVPVYAENPEGAFRWLMSMLTPYVQERFSALGQRPNVLKSWGEKEENQGTYLYTMWLALQGQVAGMPTYNAQNAKVWDIFHQYMTKAIMMSEGENIADIMAECQRKCEALQ